MARGEAHGQHRLTEAAVRTILECYGSSSWSPLELARRFGVSRSAVYHVAERKTWKHVSW